MGELKISGLVEEGQIEELEKLDEKLNKLKNTYVNVATELAKGIKMEVETPKDLDKLYSIYTSQASLASKTSLEFNSVLEKQKSIINEVADNLQRKATAENLSSKEVKALADATAKNATALEKSAKAEAALIKVQESSNATRKKTILSEEERLKLISSAITLTNKDVHSRAQAKEMNKQLQRAVDVLRDSDENYIRTLARLNSTIGINSDYIKRNSDRYSQQKMTIGSYRNEIKAAIIELENGNRSMQNMGVIARNSGMMLQKHMGKGLSQVGMGLKGFAAGYIGAQAVVNGIVALFTKLREGVGSIVEFEFANSKLAAILGTTSNKIKDLTTDAQRLGAMTKYTASEATELQIELAKLGFTRKEILESTEAILRFAQATGAELSDAAALSGAALRMFNADTKETERYVSAMAVSTARSALSFSYLATALPIVGPVAKSFNFTIEDTLALVGKLADAGFDASMSATATRNILLNLADSNGALAKSLGGPVKTLPELVAGLQKLKKQGIDLNTTLELTDKRSVAAFNAFLTAVDKIIPLRDQITGVDDELAGMAHTMEDNVKGALANLSSAWEAFMLSFSSTTGPAKEFLNWMANRVRGIADSIKDIDDRLSGISNTSTKQGEDTYDTHLLELKTTYNKRMKKLIDAGDTQEQASLKAMKEISSQKTEISEIELKQLENLRSKALEQGRIYEKEVGFSWKKIIGFGDNGLKNTNDADVAMKKMIELQNQFQTFQYTISKKEARNSAIDDFLKGLQVSTEKTTNTTLELTDKEKRELEKAEQEKLKIKEIYEESNLALMDEGLEKELAKIGIAFSKKMAAVKGNNDKEIAARGVLAKEMKKSLDDYTIKYNSEREKTDIDNAIAIVRKGSEEELNLKIRQLELQRELEFDSAEKTGENVFLIDEKYAKKRQELYESHVNAQVQLIAENAASEQVMRDQQYLKDMSALKKLLAEKKISKKDYAEQEYQITLDYTRKSSESAIDALEQELNVSKLGAEDKASIAEKLQKLKAELAQKEADVEIEALNKIEEEEAAAYKKRMDNLRKWLQVASDAVGGIGDLVGNVYDAQIDKIENEQDANDEAYDRDIERIEDLTEKGVITEEEAEVRKRAAKAQTEAKNAELEKKKQEIAHKQAVWDKATSIAQAGIATALAITHALPNFVLAAIVGAIGAIQVATIAATPIPSYAEGTKDGFHPGGKALVGDAGKKEVVMYNGLAWITPDTPMIVDLPQGAQVFPDVNEFGMPNWDFPTFSPLYADIVGNKQTKVVNDFSRLEKRVDKTNSLLEKNIRMQRQIASDREFELYKLKKL